MINVHEELKTFFIIMMVVICVIGGGMVWVVGELLSGLSGDAGLMNDEPLYECDNMFVLFGPNHPCFDNIDIDYRYHYDFEELDSGDTSNPD